MILKNKKIRIIAMIPSRMGSKRVKKKNIRLIDGKPLIQYIIDKVSKSNKFDEIYINSEDKIFNKIAKKNNIFFFQRSKKLSSDKENRELQNLMNNNKFLNDINNHLIDFK